MAVKPQRVVVNGKVYKLQHPGNREWLKLKGQMYSVQNDSLNMISLLDYCFEHVVFPEEGNKLNLDEVDLAELEEVWGDILPRFLRGKLDSEYIYPEDRKSKSAGQKLLQESS